METQPRTLWTLVVIGIGMIVLLILLLQAGEQASGAATTATRVSCARSVQKLTDHIKSLDPAKPGIDARIARTSFRACTAPDAWRVRAERAGLATALGVLVNDPTMETDRALDVMCTHLDPYETTRVCKAHEGANLGS